MRRDISSVSMNRIKVEKGNKVRVCGLTCTQATGRRELSLDSKEYVK